MLGVDRFMSEARAITNLIGNGVATVVIAKSEGAFTVRGSHRSRPGRREGPVIPSAARDDDGNDGSRRAPPPHTRRADRMRRTPPIPLVQAIPPLAAAPPRLRPHAPSPASPSASCSPPPSPPRRSRPPSTPPAATRWRRGSTAAWSSPSARRRPPASSRPGQLPAFRYLTGFLEPDAALVLVAARRPRDRHALHPGPRSAPGALRRLPARLGGRRPRHRPRRALHRGARRRRSIRWPAPGSRSTPCATTPATTSPRPIRSPAARSFMRAFAERPPRRRAARRPPGRRQPPRAEEPGRAGAAPPRDRHHRRRAAGGDAHRPARDVRVRDRGALRRPRSAARAATGRPSARSSARDRTPPSTTTRPTTGGCRRATSW